MFCSSILAALVVIAVVIVGVKTESLTDQRLFRANVREVDDFKCEPRRRVMTIRELGLPTSNEFTYVPHMAVVYRCEGYCHTSTKRCLPTSLNETAIVFRVTTVNSRSHPFRRFHVTNHTACGCMADNDQVLTIK